MAFVIRPSYLHFANLLGLFVICLLMPMQFIRGGLSPLVTVISILQLLVYWRGQFAMKRWWRTIAFGWFFVLYSVIGLISLEEKEYGIQNIMIFSAFLLGLGVGHVVDLSKAGLARVMILISVVTIGIVCYSEIKFGFNSGVIFGERPMALFSVILSCWSASVFIVRRDIKYLFITGLLGLAIFMTLSRTSAFLFLFSVMIASLTVLRMRFVVAGLVILLLIYFNLDALMSTDIGKAYTERFFKGEMVGYGDVQINATGRSEIWIALYEEWIGGGSKSVLWGMGPGAGGYYLSSYYQLNTPHNEYLRVAADYGLFGFFFWFFVHARLVYLLWERKIGDFLLDEMEVITTARLVAVVYMAAGVVLNPMVFAFIAVPVGLFIGRALKVLYASAGH